MKLFSMVFAASFAIPLLAGCGGVSILRGGQMTVALPPPSVTPGSLDGRPLLDEASAQAVAAGAGAAVVVASGEASERERVGAFVVVPDGVCLLAYARASHSVEDLDLAAFSDEGNPVALDDAPDAHPTVLVCPPLPSRIYLAAVVASGEGLVSIGASFVPVERSAAIGKAMNAHGTRSASSRAADTWSGLDDHVRKHETAIGGKWEVFRKVAVAVDARAGTSIAFPLEAGGCTDAVVVPDDDVGAVEFEIVDDGGRVVGRSRAVDRDRVATVCSPSTWNGSMVIRPHVGQGLVAVVLARGRGDVARDLGVRPDVAWFGADEPLDKMRARHETELHAAGYGDASGVITGNLSVGSLRSMTVGPAGDKGGRCARIDVIGGKPLALVFATTWDDAGRRLTSAEGGAFAALFSCGADKVRLDLEARARAGPYVVVWRPEPWADPAFGAHPMAAARMLTRMTLGDASRLPGSPSRARWFHGDAGRETAWEEVIPKGECLRVVAAAEGDGAGLVVRVVDVATGEELDRGHASEAALATACAADDVNRQARVSVEVTAGKLDVVVGERLLAPGDRPHAP